jgi:hypothetical protein
MNCYLCGNKIGFFRRMVDQRYCSNQHRYEASLVSARALRDAEDLYDEPWSVAQAQKKQQAKKSSPAGAVIAVCFVAILLIVAVTLPNPTQTTYQVADTTMKTGGGLLQRAGAALGAALTTSAPVTLTHDFSAAGFANWSSSSIRAVVASAGDGSPGLTMPGSSTLRIWDRTTSLSNYQMDFTSNLDKRSLAFAFRASDARNYYATRITILRPGPLPNAGLVRYVMMDGREWDRVQLPLPLTLEKGKDYRVRVSVQDDRFITWVNGQVVSTWSDKRLAKGGIGFFQDATDASSIRSVALAERDSFIGRMLSHFSLFKLPAY